MLAANPTVLIPMEGPACCRIQPHLHVVHASHSQVPPPQAVKCQAGEGEPQLVPADDGCAPVPGALSAAPVCTRRWFSVSRHHITSRHITSRHVTSRHVTSRHVTSHHITSHHIHYLL